MGNRCISPSSTFLRMVSNCTLATGSVSDPRARSNAPSTSAGSVVAAVLKSRTVTSSIRSLSYCIAHRIVARSDRVCHDDAGYFYFLYLIHKVHIATEVV